MENSKYMLAAMAAFTLIMSVVSGVNPSYFAGQNAFAEEADELVESLGEHSKATLETDDGEVDLEVEIEDGDLENGEHNVIFACTDPEVEQEFANALEVEEGEGEFEVELDLEEGEYSGCEVSTGGLSALFPSFAVLANENDDEEEAEDDEHEEDDDDKGRPDREDRDEYGLVQSLGNHSKVTLEVDDDEAELEVEIEEGDLRDGTYDVTFECDSPDVNEEFADALEVKEGNGEFEIELALSNGTYTGCEVDVGGLAATLPTFSIMSHEDDDEEHDERKHNDIRGHKRDAKFESRLKAEDDRVEFKVEVEDLNMTDGSYDAIFACEDPDFSMTLENAFNVEDGEGELEETIGFANGTYSGCDITIEGTVLASFDTFTVSEDTEDEQERKVEQKRKEKRERIITTINGAAIHERHRSQNAVSPGEYEPSWNYTLVANGTATHRAGDGSENADTEADINMAVWKSNRAIILLDVIDGTVQVENQNYTVVLGYAIYVIQHDTMRVAALAVDDDGNIFKLKLRGSASEDADFPIESGSIDLTFEGSSGSHDRLGDWNLTLEGTVAAS